MKKLILLLQQTLKISDQISLLTLLKVYHLPDNMGAIGKFNKTVCQVLLAKAMMQMNKDYAGALPLLVCCKNW